MTRTGAISRILIGLVIVGAAIWMALNRDRLDPALIESAVRDLGLLAPLAHILLFALATILFVPGVIFGLAGGALFGPLLGTILNLTGATLGATAAFLIARYLAADWVRKRAGPRLERLINGVEAEGWRFVAFVRLVPLFPFNLTNYALGLTRVPLAHYVLASLVCMVPGTVAYTWLGYAGREALAGNETAIRYGLLALALLAAVAFLPRLKRRLRGGATTAANDDRSRKAIRLPQMATALAVLSCYGTLALVALLSLIGVSLAIDDSIWAGAISLFATLAVLALAASYRRHGATGPTVAGLFGLALILWVMLGSYNRFIEGAGFALLIFATVWDWLAARRARTARALFWIDPGDLIRSLHDTSIAVVDVRGPDEFTGNLGHIANALNLPVDELQSRLSEINALKERPVILVCRTDKRSATASALLRDAGFRDVRVLLGGMVEWNRSGLPVEGRNAAEQTAAAGGLANLSVGANQ
jgi:uncharacterized membrane protein YdjX (TVP38/TMEM64 family)/rhodanese-related sulfurtransferase